MLYLPIAFYIIRYTIHTVGTPTYGIWAALTTVLAFQSLFDFGVTAPLIKYIAECNATGEAHRINVLLGTAMVFYAAVSIILGIVLFALTDWVIVHLIHASPHDVALRVMYQVIVVCFSFQLCFGVLACLIIGLHRSDLWGILTFLNNLQTAVGTIVFLGFFHLGLRGLVANWAVGTVFFTVLNWIAAKRLFPALRLNPLLFRWTELRRLLGFSLKVQVSSLALYFNNEVDRFAITYAIGPTSVAYYQVANRVASTLVAMVLTIDRGALPAASEFAVTDRQRLRQLYLRGTRYEALVAFPLFTGTAALAFPFVRFWLGAGFDQVALTLIIIVASYTLWLSSGITYNTLNGINRPDVRMQVDLALVLVHVPIAAFLVWRFGYFGTVIGTSSLFLTSRVAILVRGARVLNTRVADLVRQSFLHPACASALAAAPVVGLQLTSRLDAALVLLAGGPLFAAVYLGYMARFGLDAYDRQFAQSTIAAVQARWFPRLTLPLRSRRPPTATVEPSGTPPRTPYSAPVKNTEPPDQAP